MIKAIIFDCYGVLVGAGFWAVYEALGGDLEKDGAFVDAQLDRLGSNKTSSQQFAFLMADRLGIPLSQFQAAFTSDELPNQPLLEYIRSTLKPNYKLAIISNATGSSVRRIVPESELQLFDEVLLSGEVGLLKPDPNFFQLALDKLGVKPDEAVFIDDHQPYVGAASSMGIHGILYKGIPDLKQQLQSKGVHF